MFLAQYPIICHKITDSLISQFMTPFIFGGLDSRGMQTSHGGRFCRVEENCVHNLSLVDSVKLGEEERPLPVKHTQSQENERETRFHILI